MWFVITNLVLIDWRLLKTDKTVRHPDKHQYRRQTDKPKELSLATNSDFLIPSSLQPKV